MHDETLSGGTSPKEQEASKARINQEIRRAVMGTQFRTQSTLPDGPHVGIATSELNDLNQRLLESLDNESKLRDLIHQLQSENEELGNQLQHQARERYLAGLRFQQDVSQRMHELTHGMGVLFDISALVQTIVGGMPDSPAVGSEEWNDAERRLSTISNFVANGMVIATTFPPIMPPPPVEDDGTADE